ncbi:MAG: sugar nucleotide-binding protein, partial [Candidatus Nanopelagicales bacterium]|nr:sugar nucleotide-binding protein [Candidatus Nanopelagicales bacterium]
MQTWLVTGARGFLGSNVGALLHGSVRLIGQSRHAFDSSHYGQVIGLDLRDHDRVAAVVRELQPDVILHAAAMSGHDTCERDRDQAYAVNG